MTPGKVSLETLEMLGQLWEKATSPEEKARLLFAMDALRFVAATGQSHDLDAYRESLEAEAPPLVIAAFDTHEAAEHWLNAHPHPPHQAYVLIAGDYHVVMSFPERLLRKLISHPVLEFYLADLLSKRTPSAVATFATHAQAQTWLDQQSEPPQQVFVTIAGETHLAAYHHRIGLRALYPLRSPRS